MSGLNQIRRELQEKFEKLRGQKTFSKLKEEGFFWKLEPGEERIEPKIRPLVDAINSYGWIATYSSCQGHTTPPIPPYISFYAKAEKGAEFVECIRRIPNIFVTKEWEDREDFHPSLRERLSPEAELIGVEFTFNFTRPLQPKDYEEVLRCLESQ